VGFEAGTKLHREAEVGADLYHRSPGEKEAEPKSKVTCLRIRSGEEDRSHKTSVHGFEIKFRNGGHCDEQKSKIADLPWLEHPT
jgi:hypothetical protein